MTVWPICRKIPDARTAIWASKARRVSGMKPSSEIGLYFNRFGRFFLQLQRCHNMFYQLIMRCHGRWVTLLIIVRQSSNQGMSGSENISAIVISYHKYACAKSARSSSSLSKEITYLKTCPTPVDPH